MKEFLVSVLMTAYNREAYIAEAIESVLASTYSYFELIIVDDMSNDNTVAIAQFYAARDKRIKLYKNEHNLGDYGNRNKAASFAKGEYLMYVDSDDTIFPDGIERCVEVMNRFPESGFGIYVSSDEEKHPRTVSSENAIREHFFQKPFLLVGPGGTIQRRSFFVSINGYPTKYGPANDMYHNLQAAAATTLVKIPFEFIFYRRHEGQEINNKYNYLYNGYAYLRDAIEELDLPLTKKEKMWILEKNDRRMLVNLLLFFFKTFNLKKTIEAMRKANYGFSNVSKGIFQ